MPQYPWKDIAQWAVVGFLAFALLWKGGKTLEATWLLMLLAWFITYVWWWTKPREDPVPVQLWIGLMVFVLWTVISYINSLTRNYGLDEVLRTASLVMVFLWTFRNQRDCGDRERFVGRIAKVIVWATFAAGVISIAVYALQPVNRMVGTFFDPRFHTDYWPNAWAGFLLLAWPLAAWWLVREKEFKRSLFLALLLGFNWAVLLLSFSRGALVAFAGQLVLWGLIEWMSRKGTWEWKEISIKVSIVLLTVLAVFMGANSLRQERFPVQSVEEKVTFTAMEGTSSVSERRDFWGQAAALAFQKPLFGWGPYSYRFIQPRMQRDILATSDHPHNVVLKYAMERGWIAAILFVVIVGSILFKVSWLPWQERKRTHVPFILLGVAGLLAHSLIDYNLQFVGIAVPLWIFLALLSLEVPWNKMKSLNKKVIRLFEIALVTILLCVAVIEAQWLIVSSVGRHLEAKGDQERALVWYDHAKDEWFSRDMHLSRAKILYGLERYSEAKEAVEDYWKVNTQDPRAWKRMGEIILASGNSFEALEYFEYAYSLNRLNDIGITRGLVRSLLASGKRAAVDERRDEFSELIERFVTAIQVNAHYIALSPNVEEVIELSNLFAKFYWNDAPLYTVLAARADHASKIERERIWARPPGYLW